MKKKKEHCTIKAQHSEKLTAFILQRAVGAINKETCIMDAQHSNKTARGRLDSADVIRRAQSAMYGTSGATPFLANNHIDVRTARKMGIGYDAFTNELIIPTAGGYIAHNVATGAERATDSTPSFMDVLAPGEEPVFIVPTWLDALAVAEAGGRAISINSNDAGALIARLETIDDLPPIIYDADSVHNALSTYFETRYGITDCDVVGILSERTGDVLTPAESLDESPGRFTDRINELQHYVYDQMHPGATQRARDFASWEASLERFNKAWQNFAHGTPRISTGLAPLDTQLGGGLYAGLTILGGRTGAGKTSLALQIADYVASKEHPVLYIALEMSAAELYAKSLARIAYDIATDRGCPNAAPSYSAILEGGLNALPWGMDVVKRYRSETANNMVIYESIGNTTMAQVREQAELVRQNRGVAPIVIVDYLQIMSSDDPRLTDKQATDRNVLGLKQLARDLDTPVIVLSALNRASYSEHGRGGDTPQGITEAAFKESGAIEYSADMLLGIERTDNRGGNAPERLIQIKLLKNRRGPCRDETGYTFRAGASMFYPYIGAVQPRQATEDLPIY